MHIGFPGPLELIIILLMGLVCIGVPVVLLIVILAVARRSSPATPDSPPCPHCGTHVVPGARFCHQCGRPLEPRQAAEGQGPP
jgi:hypothetical protein